MSNVASNVWYASGGREGRIDGQSVRVSIGAWVGREYRPHSHVQVTVPSGYRSLTTQRVAGYLEAELGILDSRGELTEATARDAVRAVCRNCDVHLSALCIESVVIGGAA